MSATQHVTHHPTSIEADPALPTITITREFHAPVANVYRAHTEADLVEQWLGPRSHRMRIDQYDCRTGGAWRYHTTVDGDEYKFRGVFHTVRENEFAIQTFEFEGYPDVVAIESMTFEDLGDGRTRLRGWSTYPSVEARDGMVESGMEIGLREGYERLDSVLAA